MKDCPACGSIYDSECADCVRNVASVWDVLPTWMLYLVSDVLVPEKAIQRALDVEWSEGGWRTWPHCCNQAGCGMHHDEPFCRCGVRPGGHPCVWCRAARHLDRWVPRWRRAEA